MLKDQNLGIYQVAHVLPDPPIYTGIMAASWRIDLWWFEGLITYICDIICRSNFGNATLWGWELHRLFLRFLQQPAEELLPEERIWIPKLFLPAGNSYRIFETKTAWGRIGPNLVGRVDFGSCSSLSLGAVDLSWYLAAEVKLRTA